MFGRFIGNVYERERGVSKADVVTPVKNSQTVKNWYSRYMDDKCFCTTAMCSGDMIRVQPFGRRHAAGLLGVLASVEKKSTRRGNTYLRGRDPEEEIQ